MAIGDIIPYFGWIVFGVMLVVAAILLGRFILSIDTIDVLDCPHVLLSLFLSVHLPMHVKVSQDRSSLPYVS